MMDDPWGSPWATANTDDDTYKKPKPPSPTKSELEPPPRALLTSNSASTLTFTTQSLWADADDRFGGWASADAQGGGSGAASPGWGGWAGGEGSASSQQLTPTPKDEGFGKASPIAWPSNAATSPGFKTLSRSGSNSLYLQPSPDPWSSGLSFGQEDRNPGVSANSAREPSPIRLDSKDGDKTRSTTQSTLENISAEAEDATLRVANGIMSLEWVEQEGGHVLGEPKQSHDQDLEKAEPASDSLSRPSSSCSDESHADEARQDSPITSIDEDARMRPQFSTRKVSGKVQELVHMFDGLAKTTATDTTGAQPVEGDTSEATPDQAQDNSQLDDGGEFGDFEDADDSENKPGSAVLSSHSSPARTPTPKMRLRQPSPQHQSASPEQLGASSHQSKSQRSRFQDLIAKFGPPQFAVELGKINQLFDTSDLDAPSPVDSDNPDSYVPDHVLIDSFTSISERKVWYRISRQGSSRKHDAGDDERYRRVAWPSSTIHLDTMAIVRRWMEEDSITGRSILGGGGSKGNLFGWNSSAEPVALDEIFGRKRNAVRTKPVVTHQLRQPPKASVDPPCGDPKASSSVQANKPVTVSFGWSSAPPANTVAQAAPIKREIQAPPKRMVAEQQSGHPATTRQPAIPPLLATHGPVTASARPVEADEEDEWGEMVSSPQDESQPAPRNTFAALGDVLPTPPSQLGSQALKSGLASPSATAKTPSKELGAADSLNGVRAPVAPVRLGASPQNGAVKLGSGDAWSSVDFALFDVSAPSTGVVEKPTTILFNATMCQAPHPDRPVPKPAVVASPATINPTPPQPPSSTQLKSGNLRQDAFVNSVISKLPDLSYMLR